MNVLELPLLLDAATSPGPFTSTCLYLHRLSCFLHGNKTTFASVLALLRQQIQDVLTAIISLIS